MTQIRINLGELPLLPNYIRNNSRLYQELLNIEDDNDYILIDSRYYPNNINITNFESLCRYIEILRYWMVVEFPAEIHNYIINNKNDIDINYLRERFFDYELIELIENILNIP